MFNINQTAAILSKGNTAVVAGPGSGKTTVIVEKIAQILLENPDARICAVTFTRDAADELPHRFAKKFPQIPIQKLCRFGTFHSIAIHQLSETKKIGSLISNQQSSSFINTAAKAASKEELVTFEMAKARIEAAKSKLERDNEYLEDVVVATYERLIARNKVTDLYDVIRNAVFGMRDGSIEISNIQSVQCTHLLIDEFQDTDEVQYAWIMEHVRRNVITTVVCDDDQTIFEWRRALGYQGMTSFIKEANAEQIVLGQNYRCSSEILEHADILIRNNTGSRIEKLLISEIGPGGKVELIKGSDVADQAYLIAEKIEPYLIPANDPTGRFDFTIEDDGWSIIARSHQTLHIMEGVLIKKKIKYNRSSGGFWNQFFLSVFLDLLRSIQNGKPSGIDIALASDGASHEGLEKLHMLCGSKFHRFLDGQLEFEAGFSKEDTAVFDRFCKLSEAWRNLLRKGAINLVIRGVGSFVEDALLSKDWLGNMENSYSVG